MRNPRDWRPTDDDHNPDGEWVHHDHGFSWGGKGRPTMTPFERHTRTFIKLAWVAMFVLVGVALLVR